MRESMLFLVLLLLPLLSGAVVVAIAWRTIPGFAEQPRKRQLPLLAALLASLLTAWLVGTWIAPMFHDPRDLQMCSFERPNV